MREKVCVRLLGRPEVLVGGERVKIPFKQAEALLYYLLVNGEATKSVLADIIWESGEQSEKVMSSMRNAVYVLRKQFGKDFLIEPVKNAIRVNPAYPVESDLGAFLEGGGAELYRGEFLEDFYLKDNNLYNEWVESERQRIAEHCQKSLKEAVERALAEKNYDRAEVLCKRLIAFDEFDESGYYGLLRLYHAKRDYLRANAAYEKLEKLYREELFEAPSQALRSLIETIREEQRSEFSQWVGERSTEQTSPARPLFFGRREECAKIGAQIEAFAAGRRAQSVALTGEGGIGKTFLVRNLLSRFAPSPDLLILETECFRGEEKYTLKPWQKILKRLIEEDTSGEHAWLTDAISTVLPFMRSGRPKHKQKDDVGVVNYQSLEQSVVEMLTQMGEKRKIVLVFDDIQWADESTISMIRHVMTDGANGSVLFVMMFKEEAASTDCAERFIENMKLAGLLETVRLERFSYNDTIAVMRLLLPQRGFSKDFDLRFYCETEGNPFFIVEIANNIRESGSLDDITPNIRDVVKNRIGYLSPECRKILELAAIFVDGVSFDVLREVSHKEEMQLVEILEQLIGRSFLREEEQPDGVVYRFTHQKIPEYIYQNMSGAKKKILHGKAAQCFERRLDSGRDDFMLYTKLIYHFERAGMRMKALKYTVRYMHGYLGVAHEYFPVVSRGIVEADAKSRSLLAGNAYNAMHDTVEDVSKKLDAALRELDADFTRWDEETHEIVSESYHLLGRYYILNCDYQKGVAYIERFKEINGRAGSKREADNLVKANKQLLYIRINRGEPAKMLAVIDETFALLPALDDPEKTAVWTRMRGMGRVMSGKLSEGEADLRAAAEIFKHCADRNKYLYNLAAAYAWLGESKRLQGGHKEADALYRKAIDTLNNFYWVGGGATFYSYAGMNAYDSGDPAAAQSYLQNAFARYDKVTLLWGRGLARAYAALLAADQKDYGAMNENLRLAQENADKLDSFYEKGVLCRVRAQLARRAETEPALANALGAGVKTARAYAQEAQESLRGIYSPVDEAYLQELLS